MPIISFDNQVLQTTIYDHFRSEDDLTADKRYTDLGLVVKIKKTSSICRGILSRNEMEPSIGSLGFKSRCQHYLSALTSHVLGNYNAPCGISVLYEIGDETFANIKFLFNRTEMIIHIRLRHLTLIRMVLD